MIQLLFLNDYNYRRVILTQNLFNNKFRSTQVEKGLHESDYMFYACPDFNKEWLNYS